jgi:NADH:ubiquinone oxidoreductase subunit 6 (subunit J)
MLGVGLWEIAAPFGAGHAAVLPARAIMADNMVHFGILYPVRAYSATVPDISQAYAHHPWGTYYLFTLVRLLFGRHEWAFRLVPVCLSVAMPSLLFFVAARLWGKIAGALSALGWAVLPIALAFAQFPSFEMFALAGMLSVLLAALRYEERSSRRRLVELLIVTFLAANTDWIACLLVGAVAVTALFVKVFGPTSNDAERRLRRVLQGVLGSGLVVALTVLVYVCLFKQVRLYTDFTNSAEFRATGNESPFLEVLASRRYWIEVMFTKVGIAVGVLGALLMGIRCVYLRSFKEALPLFILGVSLFHYVYFKNGADIHIYWPLPFAAQFCLSLGVLGATLDAELRLWAKRPQHPLAGVRADYVAVGCLSTVALAVFPDGLRALDYSRDTGFRLNDNGQLNLQDYDKNLALKSFQPHITPGKAVILNPSLLPNWSQDYALERPTTIGSGRAGIRTTTPNYSIYDVRLAPPTTLSWAQSFRHNQVGPYLLVNTAAVGEPTVVQGFVERSPSLLERYFVQSHDPIRSIAADPYLTWEFGDHLAVGSNPVPAGLDKPEHRVTAYNVAVATKDETRAKALLETIEQGLIKKSATRFADGTRLLGHRLLDGTPPLLEVYFLAARSYGGDVFFDVRSRVRQAPRFSFVVADDKEKKYGLGFVIHPAFWKKDRLYVSRVEVRDRPGTEVFFGRWRGNLRPLPIQGSETVVFFERP